MTRQGEYLGHDCSNKASGEYILGDKVCECTLGELIWLLIFFLFGIYLKVILSSSSGMTLNGFLPLLFIFGDSRILTLDSAFFDHGSSVDYELLPLLFILGDSRVLTLTTAIGASGEIVMMINYVEFPPMRDMLVH
jgi:hypothetical protein